MLYSSNFETVLSSYVEVKSGDGTDTVPTAFPLGVTSGDFDVLNPNYGGKGNVTQANYLESLFLLDAAGTATIEMTGACDGGPEEYICSLALSSAGGIVESGSLRWADTITLTNTHLTDGILVRDSGNSRVCKFGLDIIGYRFIKFYSTAIVTATNVKVYVRYF